MFLMPASSITGFPSIRWPQIEGGKEARMTMGRLVLVTITATPIIQRGRANMTGRMCRPGRFNSHIIVAIEKGRPAAMTAWFMDENTEQFAPLELVRE